MKWSGIKFCYYYDPIYISHQSQLYCMTLGPVHIKAISELADRIDRCLKPDDREEDDTDGVMDILERLRELKHDGKVVLKAIGRLKRGKVSIEKWLKAWTLFLSPIHVIVEVRPQGPLIMVFT